MDCIYRYDKICTVDFSDCPYYNRNNITSDICYGYEAKEKKEINDD